MSALSSPDTIAVLRQERFQVHQEYLALCAALGSAALHAPEQVPALLVSLQQLADARTGLDLLLASYAPHASLVPDEPCP